MGTRGPEPDYKKDAKVKEYKDKNKLSFRQIAKLMQEPVSTSHIRYHRAVRELSTQ